MPNNTSTTNSANARSDASSNPRNDFDRHRRRTSKATSKQANNSDQDASSDKSWTQRPLTIGLAAGFASSLGGLYTVILVGHSVFKCLLPQTSNSQLGTYDTANTTSNNGSEVQPNIAFETTQAYHPNLGTASQWQPQCPAGSEAPETLLLCASLPEGGGQCASINAAWDHTKFVTTSLKNLGSDYYIAHGAFSKAAPFIPDWMHNGPGRFEMPEETWKAFLSQLRLNHYDPAQDDPAQDDPAQGYI